MARHGIFHLSGLRKHIENSVRGIRRAARRFLWVDIDELITKADPDCTLPADDEEHIGGVCHGHILGCHWDRPMKRESFYDPEGKIDPATRLRDMTIDEALRLRTRDGYEMHRIRALFKVCAARNIGAYVEPKDDSRFEQDWPWIYQMKLKHRYKVRLRARSIRNFATRGAGRRRVRAARRNGVRAKTIRG